ncbi:MAG: bifunctional tetrahydrofolate synthase/dihydrofolate synthase, partial [Shewanella sp.]
MYSAQKLPKPAPNAALEEWLAYLLSIHPTEIDMGLSRVATVAQRLGLLQQSPAKVVTVGGTNGKGTT